LIEFFTQRVENFPNGKKLAKFLAKINNISCLQPQEEPDIEALWQLSDEFYERLNLTPLPLRIIRDDWVAADRARSEGHEQRRKDLQNAASKAAWNVKLNEAWKVTDDITLGAASVRWCIEWDKVYGMADAIRTMISDARWVTGWMIEEDFWSSKGYKGNPLELLFEGIWDKGYYYVGPVRREVVIFVPPIAEK
jgi:hypothetical protein